MSTESPTHRARLRWLPHRRRRLHSRAEAAASVPHQWRRSQTPGRRTSSQSPGGANGSGVLESRVRGLVARVTACGSPPWLARFPFSGHVRRAVPRIRCPHKTKCAPLPDRKGYTCVTTVGRGKGQLKHGATIGCTSLRVLHILSVKP